MNSAHIQRISILYKIILCVLICLGVFLSFEGAEKLWHVLRYFTIQSNILTAIALIALIFMPRTGGNFRSVLRGSVMLCIVVTGLVFHAILVPQQDPGRALSLSDHLTHTIAPLGFVMDWLLFDAKGRMRYRDFAFWALFPTLYWLVMMLSGASTGFYPYFFMDAGVLGTGGALLWLMLLYVVFALLGFGIITVDHWLKKAKA